MKSLLRLVGWLFIGLLFGIVTAMVISALVDGTSPLDEVKEFEKMITFVLSYSKNSY